MSSFFLFTFPATTEIYTLSLHDALPIYGEDRRRSCDLCRTRRHRRRGRGAARSEEHTSELQSQSNLVCRLLLEKKKTPSNTLQRSDELTSSRPSPSVLPRVRPSL